MLLIVGLGDGTRQTLTLGGLETLKKCSRCILQTDQVPVAEELKKQKIEYETLDFLYDSCANFDQFIDQAVAYLLEKPEEDTCFGVLGTIWQNKCACILAEQASQRGIDLQVIPGVGHESRALWSGHSTKKRWPCKDDLGAIVVSGGDFTSYSTLGNTTYLITEVDTLWKASDIKLKLLDYVSEDHQVLVYRHGEELWTTVEELDQLKGWFAYDTCIVVPPEEITHKQGFVFEDLVYIMEILRGKGGCPWDAEQTHQTLKRYLLEEAYEVFDAIDKEDMFELADELGDVLLQVVFHGQIGQEYSEFTHQDVVTNICRKMIDRHVHIFGDKKIDTAKGVIASWEEIKKKEKGQKSVAESLRDIPKSMSALMRAGKLQKKAGAVGFDWPDYQGAYDKVIEELEELRDEIINSRQLAIEEEAGDLLFAAVNLLRLVKVDGEMALTRACDKFVRRFETMEQLAQEEGKVFSNLKLDEMDRFWELAKQKEKDV